MQPYRRETSLFVCEAKQQTWWQKWHFCLFFFYYYSLDCSWACPSGGRHSGGTTGYLAGESDARRDALKTGSGSQQDRFKRLKPGQQFNEACQWRKKFQNGFILFFIFFAFAPYQRLHTHTVHHLSLATNLTSHLPCQIIIFLQDVTHSYSRKKKKEYMTRSSFSQVEWGLG